MTLTLILVVILVALVFEYINGFHDTANSIATVVGTKVLSPRMAVAMAALTNLTGALFGHQVAKTITSGLVDTSMVSAHWSQQVLICALLGGIAWNLITWWFGLPSSSTHAMVGGLCGAYLAAAGGNWHVIKWADVSAKSGVYYKVIVPMVSSPLIGFAAAFVVMGLLYLLVRSWRPLVVNRVFGKLQLVSAAYMGFSHGFSDAQKTMGIITMSLLAATGSGALEGLPHWMGFLHTTDTSPAVWVKVMCALTMAAGTAAGGWRIIKTLGHKMVKLQPIHGFAAETTAATVLYLTGLMGMTVSTTHAITTSIMGVGSAKRFSALKFTVVERILWAWVMTLPAAGIMAYVFVQVARACGWVGN